MEEKQREQRSTLAVRPTSNPIAQLHERFKEMERGFRSWRSKQPLHVEAAVVTAIGAAQGAAVGGLLGALTTDAFSSIIPLPGAAAALNLRAIVSLLQTEDLAGGPLMQARNFSVMVGSHAGISCVMKRVRGVKDVQGSMVAAFGSGAMFSLVSGIGFPNQSPNAVTLSVNAVTSGLFSALVQGGLFKVGQKFSHPLDEDLYYAQTRRMLTVLGLQNYEKNFKRGLLTDSTIPLLTDSALRDVKIPPGPRLLILDFVHRDPEVMKAKR